MINSGSTLPATTLAGITLLRVSLGIMFLAHSIVLKLLTYTLAGTANFFESVGLPGWLSYVTFFAEALGVLCVAQFLLGDGAFALSPSVSPSVERSLGHSLSTSTR